MSRNEKFWVDQVTVPQPPLGNDKGGGTTRGGGVIAMNLVSTATMCTMFHPHDKGSAGNQYMMIFLFFFTLSISRLVGLQC